MTNLPIPAIIAAHIVATAMRNGCNVYILVTRDETSCGIDEIRAENRPVVETVGQELPEAA